MLPFVRIGPLLIQLPGLALLAGIWVGTTLVESEAKRLRLNVSAILNMIIFGLVAGLVGARLVYALEHLNAYLAAPLGLLALPAVGPGGGSALDAPGGLLVGAAAALIYGRRKRLPFRLTLDTLAPGLAVFMIAVGVANLLSGNGYGAPLQAPWAIFLWGEYRHPTQIYETLLALVVFLTWRYMPAGLAAGIRFCQVVGLTAAARLFSEAFRADSATMLGGFRQAQVIALIVLAAAFYVGRRWALEPASAQPSTAG